MHQFYSKPFCMYCKPPLPKRKSYAPAKTWGPANTCAHLKWKVGLGSLHYFTDSFWLYASLRELEARESCKQVRVITEAQCSRRGQVSYCCLVFQNNGQFSLLWVIHNVYKAGLRNYWLILNCHRVWDVSYEYASVSLLPSCLVIHQKDWLGKSQGNKGSRAQQGVPMD